MANNGEKTRQDKANGVLDSNNDPQYVTLADLAKLIEREQAKISKVPRQFVRQPPYPSELLHKPYPRNYEVPTFSLYDGRRGNTLEHVSKFIDTMGPYASDSKLCLHKFSKSLSNKAYSWYITIPARSIKSWEDMVECFCGKYYQEQEEITLIRLHNIKQRTGEDLLDYIRRFRDTALECHVRYEEHELVEICIDNMFSEYKIHLENLEIKQFALLLQKTYKTATSWKTNKRAWKTSERSKTDKRLPKFSWWLLMSPLARRSARKARQLKNICPYLARQRT